MNSSVPETAHPGIVPFTGPDEMYSEFDPAVSKPFPAHPSNNQEFGVLLPDVVQLPAPDSKSSEKMLNGVWAKTLEVNAIAKTVISCFIILFD